MKSRTNETTTENKIKEDNKKKDKEEETEAVMVPASELINSEPVLPVRDQSPMPSSLGSFEEMKKMATIQFELYEFVIKHVIDPKEDYQTIRTSSGSQRFMKKTGFRKLALAFNISSELMEENFREIDGGWFWKIRVRATAPNGRYADGIGICSNYEKGMKKSMHDAYATAYTRALNRSISDLVGCGLVSIEEVMG